VMLGKPPNTTTASLLARLLNKSRQSGEDYQFLLHRYAAERFLYRLGESEHRENFVLKGAMLLALWGGGAYRPTRDLDFTAYGNSWKEHVRGTLREISSIPAEDGIVFNHEEMTLESIRDQSAYNSFRAKLKAYIGKTRIPLQIDIGFGDAIQTSPVDSEYTTLLDHPSPRIRIYPREAVVAEKLHAMVVLGARNSRYKDFYDIYTLSTHFAFDGEALSRAVRATFQLRGTPLAGEIPFPLTPQFYAAADRARSWRNFLERSKLLGAPAEFEAAGDRLSSFLSDLWRPISQERKFTGVWPAGGPWRYKPYPEYRDSGIEWLGEIPAHWEAKRTKHLLAKNDNGVWGSDFGDDDGTIVLRSTEQTIDGHWVISNPAERKLSVSEYSGARLLEGDLVVTKSSGSSQHIGKTSIVTKEIESLNCCFSNFMQRLRVKSNVAPRFAWYALNGDLGRKQFDYSSGTTSGLANLNGEIIGMVSLAVPPLHEQLSIAEFLDRETGKIDALMTKKERLIELLKEKRIALITQAVTRGLDPDAPMRDSGIEWLGEIPAHWEVRRTKHLMAKNDSGVWGNDSNDGGIIVLRSTEQTIDGHWAITDPARRRLSESEYLNSRLAEGDLVVTKSSGSPKHIGKTSFVTREIESLNCCFSNFMQRLSVRDFMVPRFAWYALNGDLGRQQFDYLSATTSGLANLNGEIIGMVGLAVPPMCEQQAIAEFLDRETGRIDALVAKVREAIERLKELRTALISAAVTGRIDVREAAA